MTGAVFISGGLSGWNKSSLNETLNPVRIKTKRPDSFNAGLLFFENERRQAKIFVSQTAVSQLFINKSDFFFIKPGRSSY